MKKSNDLIRMMMVSGLIAAALPTAGAFAEDRAAALLAAQQQQAQIVAAAVNPAGYIADLVAQWQPVVTALGYPAAGWEAEFTAALKQATPEQLLAIKGATSYDAVRSILQGQPAPVSADGLSIQDLGDTSTDLTFTPLNPPCRILDTRNIGGVIGGGPLIPGNSTKNYYVHGSGAVMAAQGGNTAGCTAPKGEPVGVALNLAAVTPVAPSHLKIYPYLATPPTVSYLNYAAGQNIANAGIVSNCYNCGLDISIYNGSTTHYLADIMGYFYPAQVGKAVEIRHGGYDLVTETITATPPAFIGATNGNTTLTVNAGDEVLIEFTAQVWGVGQVAGTAYPAYWDTTQVLPAGVTQLSFFENQVDFCFPSTGNGDLRSIQSSARVTMPVAGTFAFGFYAYKGADGCANGAAVDYNIMSKKISVTKIRRP